MEDDGLVHVDNGHRHEEGGEDGPENIYNPL